MLVGKQVTMADTVEKIKIKNNSVSVNLNARKVRNGSTMLYLKANNTPPPPKVLSNEEANRKLTAEDKVKYDTNDKENWNNKPGQT